jgi:hypothetical protein
MHIHIHPRLTDPALQRVSVSVRAGVVPSMPLFGRRDALELASAPAAQPGVSVCVAVGPTQWPPHSYHGVRGAQGAGGAVQLVPEPLDIVEAVGDRDGILA